MQLTYYVLDVFTNEPFAGNPLAVVTKADNLNDRQMQKIAGEFNYSETVFMRQPAIQKHTASLRIFTPKTELPFAGHPTVGAAVLLGLQQRASAIRLEEKIGLITAIMEQKGRSLGSAHFSLPVMPEEKSPALDISKVAVTLGIAPEDIGCGQFDQVRHFSAGVDYYLVPVRDAEVLARIDLERRGWAEVYPAGHGAVYVFTQTPQERDNDLAARMFSPGMGIDEDPATGSAAAALIGLLATDPSHSDGQRSYKLRQGKEMGRLSFIDVQVGMEGGNLIRGGIGGDAVLVSEGTIDVAE